MSLAEPAALAAARARDAEYVRIVAAPTGEAVASAAILLLAFRREGIDAHVSFCDPFAPFDAPGLDRETCFFALDCGLADPPFASAAAERAVVVSRDGGRPPEGALAVTASAGNLDGATEASAAALAYLVAHSLDRKNADLAFLAIVGAIAAGPSTGSLVGLHGSLATEAEEGGVVRRRKDLLLAGPIASALAAADPFLKGVAGRARAARKLAEGLRLDPDATVASLEDAERQRLASALALHLVEQGAPASAVDRLFAPDVVASAGPFLGRSAHDLADVVEGAIAAGRPGDALAFLLGGAQPVSTPDPALGALIRAERDPLALAECAPGASRRVARAAAGYLAGGKPALAWERRPSGDALLVGAAPRESRADVAAAFRKAAGDGVRVLGCRLLARASVPAPELPAFAAAARAAMEGS